MTANMIKGKGFRGALNYNLEKVKNDVAEVLDHSFVQVSEKSIMKEIQMVKVMRPNLQKFFYHTSINFPPTEDLSNGKMRQIGQDYLEASGFNQHHFIMFRHRDAEHPHLHILVSRIGFDGKVMSDSNDFAKCEKIMRDLEKKYNLTEVISSKQDTERAVTKNEIEMMNRVDDHSQKRKIQSAVHNALKDGSGLTLSEFVRSLEVQGVNVLFNQAKTGYVSGISYGLDGFLITGSKLGNAYKWTILKNTIEYHQERDNVLIKLANERAKMHSEKLSIEVTSGTIRPRRRKAKIYKRSKLTRPQSKVIQKLFSKPEGEGALATLFRAESDRFDNIPIDQSYTDQSNVRRKKKRRVHGRRM